MFHPPRPPWYRLIHGLRRSRVLGPKFIVIPYCLLPPATTCLILHQHIQVTVGFLFVRILVGIRLRCLILAVILVAQPNFRMSLKLTSSCFVISRP